MMILIKNYKNTIVIRCCMYAVRKSKYALYPLVPLDPIQRNSRTFLAYRTELNRTELNIGSRDPNFFNISIFLWVRFDRTELCFNAFEWFYMMYLMHLNDFYAGSIEPNSKKHRNIEKIRYTRKVLEFHCTTMVKEFITAQKKAKNITAGIHIK